MEIDKTRNE